MIPLKLTLQNFLCYRGALPTLDLTGIHVACLSGPNGHGKSALLDSITWALWGKARGRSVELIHHGETDMQVELEFEARGSTYRVARRFRAPGRSNLELQVRSGDGFRPITGNNMRDTQAVIDRIIGMDYDTFINSAFLIQGRADEFTNKQPSKRKEVLGKIIGLDRYDRLRDDSRRRATDTGARAGAVESQMQFMAQETARKPELEVELERVSKDAAGLAETLDALGQRVDSLQRDVQGLELKSREAAQLDARTPALERELAGHRKDAGARAKIVASYRVFLEDAPAIEAGLAEYNLALDEETRLNAARAQFDGLNGRAAALERTVAQARARLEERAAALRQRLDRDLVPRQNRAPELRSQLSKLGAEAASLQEAARTLETDRATVQELTSRAGRLEAQLEPLKTEGQDLRKKVDILNASHVGARCPLCDTVLGEADCQRLAQDYETLIEDKRRQYSETQAALKGAGQERERLSRAVAAAVRDLNRRQDQSARREATLRRDLQDSERAAVEARTAAGDLATLDSQLDDKEYAAGEQTALTALRQALDGLDYSQDRHGAAARRVRELQSFQLRSQRLDDAQTRLPQEEQALASAEEAASRRQSELTAARERLESLRSELPLLPAMQQDLADATKERRELTGSQQRLAGERGRLEGELTRVSGLERELAQRKSEHRSLLEEQSVYEELTAAFGRQGVQALLIDTLLPEIENEANELLGRMTDGRMHVRLVTQRPRAGNRDEFTETLEIHVSDELGPRAYEMFSGGEAFRINLALRIALSKVLANRSGAPLPTLFIDEGFGTQDTAGRERILDALQSIANDFKCVIVITHLDEMKDAFPVRIEVTKRDGASTYAIL